VMFVEQSEFSSIWYVRDATTGAILIERETKRGALSAMKRIGEGLQCKGCGHPYALGDETHYPDCPQIKKGRNA
jgi:hypothetical protein